MTTNSEQECDVPILFVCNDHHDQNSEVTVQPFSKHPSIPLSHEWNFYYEAPPKYVPKHAKNKKVENTEEDEKERLKKIFTFSSVQEFWGLCNNIPQINQLGIKASYHLMRKDVEPRWEDPFNERGGIWTVRISKQHALVFWQNLLLATIGGTFFSVLEEGDEISGVTFGARKVDVVFMVWNKKGDISELSQTKLFKVIESCMPESKSEPSGDDTPKRLKIETSFYKKNNDHTDFATKK